MASKYREGQTATRANGQKLIFQGGAWRALQAQKVSPEDDKVVQQALMEAEQARHLSQAAQDFLTHNERANTGTIYAPLHVHLPLFGNVGGNPIRAWEDAHNPDVASMESLNNRFAPQMRPVGTGRLMSQEYAGFKRGFPNVESTLSANRSMASDIAKEAARRTMHSEFLENYAHSTGSLAGAEDAFARVHGDDSRPAMVGAPAAAAPPTAPPPTRAPAAPDPLGIR